MGDNGLGQKPVKDWTSNQRKVLKWLALSKYERQPSTQRALAKELGVNEATISRWIAKMPQDAINAVSREMLKGKVPNVLGAIYEHAMQGSFQHAKLLLEMVGELSDAEKLEIAVKIGYADDYARTHPATPGPTKHRQPSA